jgi:hypothetical protein
VTEAHSERRRRPRGSAVGCPRQVDTPHRGIYIGQLVTRDRPVDGQIPPPLITHRCWLARVDP